MGLPCNESVEEKLSWLRSQIIGHHAEFDSPFGRRKLLYADHTASGRSLHYNENFIINHLLPFYGMLLDITHSITIYIICYFTVHILVVFIPGRPSRLVKQIIEHETLRNSKVRAYL